MNDDKNDIKTEWLFITLYVWALTAIGGACFGHEIANTKERIQARLAEKQLKSCQAVIAGGVDAR